MKDERVYLRDSRDYVSVLEEKGVDFEEGRDAEIGKLDVPFRIEDAFTGRISFHIDDITKILDDVIVPVKKSEVVQPPKTSEKPTPERSRFGDWLSLTALAAVATISFFTGTNLLSDREKSKSHIL